MPCFAAVSSQRRLYSSVPLTWTPPHFCWPSYHLYNYSFFAKEKTGEEPDAQLVMNEEDLEYRTNDKIMDGVKLLEYIPEYKHILYVYDYGDDWRHYIEVTGVLDECTGALPAFLGGEGDAPPKDVGGIPGFANFLEAMDDPENEDHEGMKEWALEQKWVPFDPELTARRLEYALRR
jgi:hypothetical protein